MDEGKQSASQLPLGSPLLVLICEKIFLSRYPSQVLASCPNKWSFTRSLSNTWTLPVALITQLTAVSEHLSDLWQNKQRRCATLASVIYVDDPHRLEWETL